MAAKACVFHRSPEKDYNVLVGDSVELRLRIKNCGDGRGNFYSDIRKDGIGWVGKYNEWLDPGDLGTFLKKSFIMPNREVRVDFYGGHADVTWKEDFHFIAYLRPRKEYCTQEIEVTTKDGVRVRATVDWGDGTSDSGTTPKTFSHQYEVVIGKSYEIKVSASGYYREIISLTLPCKPKITSVLPKLTETCDQRVRVVTSDGASVRARLDWGDGTHEDFTTPKTCFYDRYEKGKTYTVTASATGYISASKRIYSACISQFTLTLTKEVAPACDTYTTKSSCEAAGCFWYNNSCHEYGPVKCSDYTDALTCVANNCYWWSDGTCHDTGEAPPVSAYEECGTPPTSSDSATYVTNWWACAYGIAVKRGICHADAIWWHRAVIADAKTDLGVTSIYLLPQVRTEEGDYVKIWMDGTYLGRFKWKCPSVSVDYGECGRIPTSSDTGTYITNWWKCAYDIAVNRGVCHTDGFWWHREAIKDIKAALGITTIYLLPQTRETDGDYVKIWMEGATGTKDYYLGRFKWKCPPVVKKDTVICDFNIYDAADKKVTDLVAGVRYAIKAYLCKVEGGGCAEILKGCDSGCEVSGEELKLFLFGQVAEIASGTTNVDGYTGFYWTPSSDIAGDNSIKLEFKGSANYNASESTKTVTVSAGKIIINVPKGVFGVIDKGVVMVYKVHKLPAIDAYVSLGLPAKDFWCETPPCTFEVVGLEKGGKYAIFPSSAISVLPYVTSKCVYEFTDKTQVIDLEIYIDPITTTICGFLELTPSECTTFLLEFIDVIYVADLISGWSDGIDSLGNPYHPTGFETALGGLIFIPFLPAGWVKRILGPILKTIKKTPAKGVVLDKNLELVFRATCKGDEGQLKILAGHLSSGNFDDAIKQAKDIIANPKVSREVTFGNFKAWLDDVTAHGWDDTRLLKAQADEIAYVAKKVADEFIEKSNKLVGNWGELKKLWVTTCKSSDEVLDLERNMARMHPDARAMHNLMRYTKDDYIKALKTEKAIVPEFANRFDEGASYMINHLCEGGEPSRYATAINALSSSERAAIVGNLKGAGKGNVASLIAGVEELGKFHKTGGVYDGITAIGDDLGDAVKAGGETKKAARTIVDDSLDFIDEIAKDVDEGKIIEKGLKGKFGARLRPYLNKLSHQELGEAWDDLRPGQKLKLKIAAVAGVLGYGSFCQFITEESLQDLGWGMGSPFFNKQWDIAEESLEDYKAFHNMMSRQMKFCCVFNPLTCVYFWNYIVADKGKIVGWERTLAKAIAEGNPLAGAQGRVLVKSYPSGAKIYVDGIYTNEETNSDIPNLTVGSHVISVWRDGYIPLQRVVTIEDSKQADCDFGNLPPIPSGEDCPEEPATVFSPKPSDPQPWGDTKPEVWWEGVGDIDCKTTPPGAEIWLDGKKTAFKTNYTLASQSAGRHTITFKKSGYRNCTVSVTVIANQPIPAYCDMTIINPSAAFDPSPLSPKAGELVTFDATDSKLGTGATITSYEWYCDDVKFGANNIKATKTFVKGSYRIKLKVTNNFGHSKEALKVLTVAEAVVPVGNIKCYCEPAGYCGRNADIFVDGKKADVTKASGYAYIKDLTPGVHTVKYNLLDVMECVDDVVVIAGEDAIHEGVLKLSPKIKESFTTTVTKIIDGDSIRTAFTDALPAPVLFTKQQIRIVGYGAPDGATARAKAKAKLAELIPVGSTINLKIWHGKPLGDLNRVLAGVFKSGVDIAKEMLKSCMGDKSSYRQKFPWVDWDYDPKTSYDAVWCNPRKTNVTISIYDVAGEPYGADVTYFDGAVKAKGSKAVTIKNITPMKHTIKIEDDTYDFCYVDILDKTFRPCTFDVTAKAGELLSLKVYMGREAGEVVEETKAVTFHSVPKTAILFIDGKAQIPGIRRLSKALKKVTGVTGYKAKEKVLGVEGYKKR